jgi:hypothetical protein
MENQKQKGRPPKPEKSVRRNHFSVWVTKDEKSHVNELIEKSGMSASQFFLTLALDTPLKRPQRKTLPAHTAELIRMLSQLAGMLSLAVLKTKDQHMQSENWLASSQSIRQLANLITLWIYEDFEIRTVHKTLAEIEGWMEDLYTYQNAVLATGENKNAVLEKTLAVHQAARQLLQKYEQYYLPDEAPGIIPSWGNTGSAHDIHDLIEITLDQIASRRRR